MSISELSVNSIVQRDSGIISAEADRDLVMVSIEKGSYYGISDVARTIWEALDQPRKISELVDELASNHDIDRSKCELETLDFLRDLLSEGLLKVTNGSSR